MLKPPVAPSTSHAPAQALAPPPIPPFTLATNASHVPQFKYQANIEDQKLTDELAAWLLEGKLMHTTPAHILAASHPIRKTLAKRLWPQHIETGAFEELSGLANTPPMPEPITSCTADFTLALHSKKLMWKSMVRQSALVFSTKDHRLSQYMPTLPMK